MQTASHIVVDPDTITVRVSIVFRGRSRGKTVITPEGSLTVVGSHARNNNALVRAIARAFRWRRLIETAVYATVQEIATAEQINASYVSRVLRITLLAPEIIEAILDQQQLPPMLFPALMKPFPLEWLHQAERFALKA